jgi:hypothetical protein
MLGEGDRLVARLHRQAAGGLARDLAVGERDGRIRLGGHGRVAAVGLLADAQVQRQRAEQRHAVLLGDALAAALAEDVLGVAAVAAHVHRHVLDDAQYRHLHLLEHAQRAARVQQRDVLRRGDDDRGGDRHALRQRELDVARARRQVDHQVIEVLPQRGGEQLLQVLGGHRPAPDRRRVLAEEQADRDRLHAVRLHRCDVLVVRALGLAGQAEHHRDAGAVDVGVEHADLAALGGQRERQVHRGGGLAHAALAGGDGDDVAHFRQRGEVLLHLVRDDARGDADGDLLHAGNRVGDHAAHFGLEGRVPAGRRIPQLQFDGDAAAVDAHATHRVRGDEVGARCGDRGLSRARLAPLRRSGPLGKAGSWLRFMAKTDCTKASASAGPVAAGHSAIIA